MPSPAEASGPPTQSFAPQQAAAMQGAASAFPYVMSFVLNLIIAFVLAQLCAWRNATTTARGASLGVLLWIGLSAVQWVGSIMWEQVPLKMAAIHAGDWLVKLVLIAVIVGVWR